MGKSSNYFEMVDVLRGFAAISVLVYHVIELFSWNDFPDRGPLIWFRIGWIGVNLFFIISGFVISFSVFSQIDKFGKNKFIFSFLIRRILRIAPLHYLTMTIFIFFIFPEIIFQKGFITNIFTHLFFIHNLFPIYHGAINGPNWSVAIEMQFYILIILIAPWIRDTKLWKILTIFLSIALFWRFITTFILHDLGKGTFSIFMLTTQLPGSLDEFMVGILLARLVRSEYGKNLLLCHTFPVVSLFACILTAAPVLSLYWKNAAYWDNIFMVTFYRTLQCIPLAFLLLFAISFSPKKTVYIILMPFLYLGKISYGIYLWHLPVILSLKTLKWISMAQALSLSVALTLILASWSWHFFENPIIDRFRK